MLISRLEIRNMRKIKQAEIDFHGPGAQIIEGANEAGKSSIAQAIAITMNGSRNFTPGMITRGEEEAEIISYTDDGLKIKTVMSASVRQIVARHDETLQRYVNLSGGVRAFLDSLCSGLEQPWALREMSDVDIVEKVMERSGAAARIDEIDEQIKEKENLRLETGRDRKCIGDPGKPLPKVKHPDPIDKIKAEQEKTREYQKACGEAHTDATHTVLQAINLCYTLEELENIIPVIEKAVAEGRGKLTGYKAYTRDDIETLDKQIADWYEIEEHAKNYDAYIEKKTQCETLDKRYEELTGEIEELRTARKKVLADMKLGVSGLEIGEDNMLYHKGVVRGVTKTDRQGNWSTAESVKVFFGLGARFSGKMKMLIVDNAESLDSKTTEVITDWAEKSGFLVILLRVADMPEELEDGVIYIREGEVIKK
jgi:DNA repair ATPase RecN